MQLEIVQKFKPTNLVFTASAVDYNSAVFLSCNDADKYELLLISNNDYKTLDVGIEEDYFSLDNNPVLFSFDKQFGVVKNQNELLIYSNENQRFEMIQIENHQILPERVRLCYPTPVSDCTVLPICFESDGFIGIPRYMAFLNIDGINRKARWESWTSLKTKSFAHHKDDKYPPKIDSVMFKDNQLYVYSSGGQITSVNKWGMDYYAFVKSSKDGIVDEILIDSGCLTCIDSKKRGVNGKISSSQNYLMLTPIFQSDEWKGKQKIYSLQSNEVSDIIFPRGLGKYPQIIEHYGDYFWVYLRDTKEIAICKEH